MATAVAVVVRNERFLFLRGNKRAAQERLNLSFSLYNLYVAKKVLFSMLYHSSLSPSVPFLSDYPSRSCKMRDLQATIPSGSSRVSCKNCSSEEPSSIANRVHQDQNAEQRLLYRTLPSHSNQSQHSTRQPITRSLHLIASHRIASLPHLQGPVDLQADQAQDHRAEDAMQDRASQPTNKDKTKRTIPIPTMI